MYRTRTGADGGRAGYTLTEVLMIVALVAIMAAIVIPTLGRGGDFQLDLAETQLRDACQQARSLAASQRSAHGVVFDVTNDRFAVVQEDGEEAVHPLTKREYVVSFDDRNQARGIDIVAADFGDTNHVAVFGANGLPFTTGTVQLACQGATRTLTLEAIAGDLVGP